MLILHGLLATLFSQVTPSPQSIAKGVGLAPVAVYPNSQSQGIGSQLIGEGLRRGQERGFDYCVVLGSSKYYRRFGLKKASEFGVANEYGVEEEFMLIKFQNCELAGVIRYAPEFAVFSV